MEAVVGGMKLLGADSMGAIALLSVGFDAAAWVAAMVEEGESLVAPEVEEVLIIDTGANHRRLIVELEEDRVVIEITTTEPLVIATAIASAIALVIVIVIVKTGGDLVAATVIWREGVTSLSQVMVTTMEIIYTGWRRY